MPTTDPNSTILADAKPCSTCHDTKSRDDFYVNRASRDGLCFECKKCSATRCAALHVKRQAIKDAAKAARDAAIVRPEGYISRADAKAIGRKTFFTGVSCEHGHIAERRVSGSGRCTKCCVLDREKMGMTPRHLLAPTGDGNFVAAPCPKCGDTVRTKHRDCPTCLKKRGREHHRKARLKNPERYREYGKESYRRNIGIHKVHARLRKEAIKRATPKWLSADDKRKMANIYKNKPTGYDVDHVIPINGVNVMGLNIPSNLQYLECRENLAKSNKYPYEAIDWLPANME